MGNPVKNRIYDACSPRRPRATPRSSWFAMDLDAPLLGAVGELLLARSTEPPCARKPP